MYKVKPKGINIKDNERIVPDGFLQESINLQWKDGTYRPIPERLRSGIDINPSKSNYILHKVSDEDKINVLGFITGTLRWFGTIEDGVYIAGSSDPIGIPDVTDFDSLSFTILNGLIYFMSSSQEFYYKVQYNETDEVYEVKDMYAWKTLIPYFPVSGIYTGATLKLSDTNLLLSQCGIILIRFTLVLNTGEEVLHSPIYSYYMYAVNTATSQINKDDPLTNIHTLVNTNLDFIDTTLLSEEVSAINIYASVPYYLTKVGNTTSSVAETQKPFSSDDAKGEAQRLAEEPLYLVKTLEKPSDSETTETILFYAGDLSADLFYYTSIVPLNAVRPSKINTDTIAAGSVMPIDNFSYHKVYGKITSSNGRLIVSNPKTVLSNGHMRALSTTKNFSRVGYHINTEDGDLTGVAFGLDTGVEVNGSAITARGILSYPDNRASYVGGNELITNPILLYKTRKNKFHNISCAFNFDDVVDTTLNAAILTPFFIWSIDPTIKIIYKDADLITVSPPPVINPLYYTSNNRIQFSESGEFSVWPAINSYRVGEGKIIFLGSNSVDPANTDYISPLLIGTSDGIYTANFDPTGANLIQSITRAANLPALSDKNLVIDQNLIYVSDKGLIVINNGRVINITEPNFPDYGDGDFPNNNTVYPNYDILTSDLSGNYKVSDIVDYMKGALLAYDGRRNNVWCSNPNEDFSLIYNLITKQWTMSTYVFKEVIDCNAIIVNSGDEIYSRYLVISKVLELIDILSGENTAEQVYVHLLTRGIKIDSTDQYKKIERLISRCELYRDDSAGKFTFGVWGKQDYNKDKVSIPLVAYEDNTGTAFPNNIRQDIPVGRMKGKYKVITILQGGLLSPKSSLDGFDIVAIPVENNILR